MTLEELARHIGMDAREIRKLAEKGVLPGTMVGGQWRFNRAQMLDWLQREMHSLSQRDIENLERATASGGHGDLLISTLLGAEGVNLNLPARSRNSALRELANLAENTGLVWDKAALIEALEERESLASTALPGGIALPHPRRPMPYATAEPLVCFGRVPSGLPFNAPDGRLTDLFFLIISHDDKHHLRVLARLALLLDSDLPSELRTVETDEEALEAITAWERKLVTRRN